MRPVKRRVDLLRCLRCGHEPLTRQGPIARCSDCGRGYPLRRSGLVDFLPESEDDDRRSSRLINPLHWLRKTQEQYRQRLAPPDTDLHRIMAKHQGGMLLHLGCGTGLILDELARHSWRLRIGAGRKLQRLLRAHRRTSAEHSLLLLRCSPYRLPLRDKTIDCLLLHNPFVEMKDPQAAMHEVLRVMNLQGQLICRVEKGQEEALQTLLSANGFISYRVGVWWVSMRVKNTQEVSFRDQAL